MEHPRRALPGSGSLKMLLPLLLALAATHISSAAAEAPAESPTESPTVAATESPTQIPVAPAHEVEVAARSLPDLNELLAIEGEYEESVRCLALHKLRHVRILDQSHVSFELRGGRFYVAQLRRKCPGMNKGSTVAYEHRSSKVCATDGIRGVPLSGGPTPMCRLSRFQPVSKEQLVLLREALKKPSY